MNRTNSLILILLIAIVQPQIIMGNNIVKYTIDKQIPSYVEISSNKNNQLKNFKSKSKQSILSTLLQLNQNTTAVLTDTLTDIVGGFHESYMEYYKGTEVDGTKCTIHYDRDGQMSLINGNFRTIEKLNTTPTIDDSEALLIALKHIGAEKYAWEDDEQECIIRQICNDSTATYYPKGELVVYIKEDIPYLVYRFLIEAIIPQQSLCVYVDAHKGFVIDVINTTCNISTQVSTRFSQTRVIQTQYYANKYRLRDYTRGNGIFTFDASHNDYTSHDNSWNSLTLFDRSALDVHWGVEATYDFYYNTFGRNSFDNKGATIISYVNLTNYENACWARNENL